MELVVEQPTVNQTSYSIWWSVLFLLLAVAFFIAGGVLIGVKRDNIPWYAWLLIGLGGLMIFLLIIYLIYNYFSTPVQIVQPVEQITIEQPIEPTIIQEPAEEIESYTLSPYSDYLVSHVAGINNAIYYRQFDDLKVYIDNSEYTQDIKNKANKIIDTHDMYLIIYLFDNYRMDKRDRLLGPIGVGPAANTSPFNTNKPMFSPTTQRYRPKATGQGYRPPLEPTIVNGTIVFKPAI